ncbi:phospholipase [Pedobacter sp. HMWF019]|uniref:carboxylesterase family protein n=1 Tax=Pedobacter sp. HMWF019 TaxID=2056856 RepID=UPI000D380628|nr:alpha/beta hydrolase-fold protein [Pedobacter sp. HMWF019]PTT04125.1 phospholipase [Pedobacter sp. HMWF019]
MKPSHLILTVLFAVAGLRAGAQDFSKYDKGLYLNKKDTLAYRILFPENFNPQQKYPVVFFLHGSGERGSDNQKQLVHGGKLFLNKDLRKKFPAIVVFPQCPEKDFWSNVQFNQDKTGKERFNFQKGGKPTKAMHALLGMIKNILDKPYADRNQVYIGGLSMGGMGTFEVLRREPKMFAAAISICGGDNIANVNRYKKVPLWIFHGGKDDVVSPELSKEIADQMKIIGKEVKYTLYADDNHNSWDSAFAEPQLLPWLFSHKKK